MNAECPLSGCEAEFEDWRRMRSHLVADHDCSYEMAELMATELLCDCTCPAPVTESGFAGGQGRAAEDVETEAGLAAAIVLCWLAFGAAVGLLKLLEVL